MITFRDAAELRGQIGTPLGPSDPVQIDQSTIDRFADVTGDHQWIHTDPERAGERGGTIAHGMLTLSLIVAMADTTFSVDVPVGINYGFDKVRFLAPVRVDSTLTATFTPAEVTTGPRGTKVAWDVAVNAADAAATACVARWWTFYPSLIEEATDA